MVLITLRKRKKSQSYSAIDARESAERGRIRAAPRPFFTKSKGGGGEGKMKGLPYQPREVEKGVIKEGKGKRKGKKEEKKPPLRRQREEKGGSAERRMTRGDGKKEGKRKEKKKERRCTRRC